MKAQAVCCQPQTVMPGLPLLPGWFCLDLPDELVTVANGAILADLAGCYQEVGFICLFVVIDPTNLE